MTNYTKIVAFDLETHRFGPANMAPKPVCLTAAYFDSNNQLQHAFIVGLDQILHWIKCYLKEAILGRCILVGHYVAYDFSCLLGYDRNIDGLIWTAYSSNRITCTSIRESLLDIAVGEFEGHYENGTRVKHGYHLAEIVERRFGEKLAKGEDTWRLRYSELDGVPLEQWPEEAKKYALTDSISTLKLYHDQEARARSINYTLPTQWMDARADFALRLMSCWGVEIDLSYVHEQWCIQTSKMQALAIQVQASGLAVPKKANEEYPGMPPLPNIKKEIKRIQKLVEDHYPEEIPQTTTGRSKIDKDTLIMCKYEPFGALLEFGKCQKMIQTYLSKMLEPVLHTRYYSVGTPTDRTKSQKPNLQNLPKVVGVREGIRARAGHVFVACDYDSQEMRTLAQSLLDLLGYSTLAKRYQEDPNFDPHTEFAASLAGLSLEEAAKLRATDDPAFDKIRAQAKISNFGFGGGMSGRTLVAYARGWGIHIDKARGEFLKLKWFDQWPEVRDYFGHVRSIIGDGGLGTQIIPRSGFRHAGVGYCDTANGYFSSLAAHASKEAAFEVAKNCYYRVESPLYGTRPILFVHDEIILEVPDEGAHEAAMEQERIMIEAMQPWVPDVPAAASAHLMRRWSKKAKRIVDSNGRLIPWENK